MAAQNNVRAVGTARTLVTGVAAWLFAFFELASDANWVGAGVGLTAAAVAFGALARQT